MVRIQVSLSFLMEILLSGMAVSPFCGKERRLKFKKINAQGGV